MISRYVLLKSTLLWCRVFREVFRPLFGCKYLLSSGLVFYSRFLSESLEAFFELGFSHGHSEGCFHSGL
jgi:hypothetical protein